MAFTYRGYCRTFYRKKQLCFMKNKEELCVSGFKFETEEAAQKARNELEGIEVVRSKVNMRSPETVLEVYNKLIDKRLCKTAVGYSYLHDLQKYLQNTNQIPKESIRDIPIEPIRSRVVRDFEHFEEEKRRSQDNVYRDKYKTSLIFNMVFAIAVVVILFLATTGDSVNIINYENKIIDRYEAWEQELTERESAVEEYEKAPYDGIALFVVGEVLHQ